MNKRELLQSVADPAIREVSARFLDLLERCERTHEPQFTYFMSPEMVQTCERLWIASKLPLRVESFGGYEEAEYKIMGIFQTYMSIETEDFPIALVEAKITAKSFEISHRDVLGSLMGIGIARNRTGDLVISGESIQMLIHKDIESVIFGQLETISRYSIRLSEKPLAELVVPEPEGERLFKTVSSMRLDAILAAGFNLSRSDALDLIRSEKVKVNHKVVSDGSKSVEETALISCRGKGRIRLLGTEGVSKKDRIKLSLLKMS